MARICRKFFARLPAWALAALAGTVASAAIPDFTGLPVALDAASSEVDVKTNTVVFKNVVISQGNMRVQADHARATGLNFANSRWNFEGNVRIDGEQRGNLRSDQAVVEFKDNHIARATITGKPAEFEQKRANSDAVARGHAGEILYDVNDGTVRLTDQAWLSDGQNEISGPLLVYNIREQRVQAVASSLSISAADAAAAAEQRVHISIAPHAALATVKPEAAKPDGTKPDAPKPDALKPEASKPAPQQPAGATEPAPKS